MNLPRRAFAVIPPLPPIAGTSAAVAIRKTSTESKFEVPYSDIVAAPWVYGMPSQMLAATAAQKPGARDKKCKLIRIDPDDLDLIERAARALNISSSYFIVQAAVARAKGY